MSSVSSFSTSIPSETVINRKLDEFHALIEENEIEDAIFKNYEISVATRQYAQIGGLGKVITQQLQPIPQTHPQYATLQKIIRVMGEIQKEMSLVLNELEAAHTKIAEATEPSLLEEAKRQLSVQKLPPNEENIANMIRMLKTTEEGVPIYLELFSKARESAILFLGNWMALYLQDLNTAYAKLEMATASGDANAIDAAREETKTAISNIQKTKNGIDAQKKLGRSSPKAEALYKMYESRIQTVDPTGALRHEINTWSGYLRSTARSVKSTLNSARKITPYIGPVALFGSRFVVPTIINALVKSALRSSLSYFGPEGERLADATAFAIQVGYVSLTAKGMAMQAADFYKEPQRTKIPGMLLSGYFLYSWQMPALLQAMPKVV